MHPFFSTLPIQQTISLGNQIEMLDTFDEAVGHVGCIIRDPSHGAWDPRSDGAVSAFQ